MSELNNLIPISYDNPERPHGERPGAARVFAGQDGL